MLEETKGMF